MDPDRPTSSYRTPAAEAAAPPGEVLGASTVPLLGSFRLELGLAAPIRLSLDRDELRLTPGSGLHLRSDGLPPLQLRHLRLDLHTAALETDATGLGDFEARAASIALAAGFTHVLDRSAVERYGDLMISAWGLAGLRAVLCRVEDGAGRAFRCQAPPPRPGLAVICMSSAPWAV